MVVGDEIYSIFIIDVYQREYLFGVIHFSKLNARGKRAVKDS